MATSRLLATDRLVWPHSIAEGCRWRQENHIRLTGSLHGRLLRSPVSGVPTLRLSRRLFDELLPDLSGGEIKVLLYIIRRTFRFKKDADTISFAHITRLTTRDGLRIDRGAGVNLGTAQAAIDLWSTRTDRGYRNSSDERGDLPTTYGLRFADPVANFYQRGVSEIGRGPLPETSNPRYQEFATQHTDVQDTVGQEFPLPPRGRGAVSRPVRRTAAERRAEAEQRRQQDTSRFSRGP